MKKILGIPENILKEIKNLFQETDIQEFKYSDKDYSISLARKNNNLFQKLETSEKIGIQASDISKIENLPNEKANNCFDNPNKYLNITSPIMGTFYDSPSPDSPPFVTLGSKVTKGSTVCIIEAMKMFNEIKAKSSGTIVSISKNKGDSVHIDEILLIIEKE